jgi:hypothetical protein
MSRGLLLRYLEPTTQVFGLHRFKKAIVVQTIVTNFEGTEHMFLGIMGDSMSSDWRIAATIQGIGISRVRTLQRWWRFMKWRARAVAVMMATHARLGAASEASILHDDVLRACL